MSTLLVFTWPERRGTNDWTSQHSPSYPLAGVSQFVCSVQAVGTVELHQVDQRREEPVWFHVKTILVSLEDLKVLHSIVWPHCRKIHTNGHSQKRAVFLTSLALDYFIFRTLYVMIVIWRFQRKMKYWETFCRLYQQFNLYYSLL